MAAHYQQSMPGAASSPMLRAQGFPSQGMNLMPANITVTATSSGGGGPPSSAPSTNAQQKEVPTASLCRLGQEVVQEIVSKTMDLFQILKSLQLPNGTPQSLVTQRERKEKLQEHLKSISMLFKRLRLIYDKCNENFNDNANENCTGMEYTHIESLIPYRDELNTKLEERKTTEVMKHVSEEHREVVEQVIQKNKHFKEIIDHLRSIIWEINTMLAMRKS